jgi:hypothetical protein
LIQTGAVARAAKAVGLMSLACLAATLLGVLLVVASVVVLAPLSLLLLVGFVVSLPVLLAVPFGLIIALQVQLVWSMPKLFERLRGRSPPTRPAGGTGPTSAIAWSPSIQVLDQQLIRDVASQRDELNGHSTELLGLTAFGTAIATADVAFSGGKHAWAWGPSVGLVAAMALFGGLLLSRYYPSRGSAMSLAGRQIALSQTLGVELPAASALRLQSFEERLSESSANAKAIGARRRLLRVFRAIVAVVVLMLVLTAVAEGRSKEKSHATSTEVRQSHGNAK